MCDRLEAMQFTLEPTQGLKVNGEYTVVYEYRVCGLPDGHSVVIRNRDYPRDLWSILYYRGGVETEYPGNYPSAEDALIVFRRTYE
jgi:hypothetical protein